MQHSTSYALGACAFLLYAPTSIAAQHRAATCSGCTTMAQLSANAQSKAYSFAQHSMNSNDEHFYLLIASDTVDMSALYLVTLEWHPSAQDHLIDAYVSSVTGTEEDAKSLDQVVFARKVTPLRIPAAVASSASSAVYPDVNTFIRQELPLTLHPILGWRVFDARVGGFVRVKIGEQITVHFADGSSAKMALMHPTLTTAWHVVHASQRDSDGRPYGAGGPFPMEGDAMYFLRDAIWWEWRPHLQSCAVTTRVCIDGECFDRMHEYLC